MGIGLDVKFKTLVGSQSVPYIYEDYCTVEDAADAIYSLFTMSPEERKKLGNKAYDYVKSEFNFQKTVDLWHESMLNLTEQWKNKKPDFWSIEEVTP